MATKMQGEDLIKYLSDKAAELKGPIPLQVKILRKPMNNNPMMGGLTPGLMHIATFEGVDISHLSSPETWLPQFYGGGEYQITVYAPPDPVMQGHIVWSGNGPPLMRPNFEAIKSDRWEGPRFLKFPVEPKPEAPAPSSISIASPAGPGHASQTQSPGTPLPGTYQHPAAIGEIVERAISNVQAQFRLELETMRANNELKMRERELHEDAERRIAEVKAQNQREIEQLKEQMRATQAAQAAQQKSGPTITEIITAGLAAATPLVQMFMQTSDSREAARREEQRRADEAAREERRRADEFRREEQRRAEENERLRTERVEKLMQAVLDKQQSPTEAAQQIMELTNSVTSMGLQLLHTASETLGGSAPESPLVKVAEHIANAIQSFGANKPAGQLPPRRPKLSVVQGEAPAKQVVADTAHAAEPAVQYSIIDKIEQMIRDMKPPEEIAKAFMDNYLDPSIQEALKANDADLIKVMQPRLGKWMMEDVSTRQGYIQKVLEAIAQAYSESEHAEDDAEPGQAEA